MGKERWWITVSAPNHPLHCFCGGAGTTAHTAPLPGLLFGTASGKCSRETVRPVRGISSSCMIPGPGGITPAALHRPASGSWIRVAEACHSQTGLIMSPLPQDASTSWAMASPRRLGLGPPGTLLQCQRHKQNGTPSSEVCGTAPPASSRFLTFSCSDLFPLFSQPLGL